MGHPQLTQHLMFPFRTAPMLVVISFTIGLALAAQAGIFGIPLAMILVSWFFKYCFVLLDAVLAGNDEPPVLSIEMVNPFSEQRPLVQTGLISLGAALVYGAHSYAGAKLSIPVASLLIFALPASLATLAVTSNVIKAAWPGAWFLLISRLGVDYLLLSGATLVFSGTIYALWHLDTPQFIPIAATQILMMLIFAVIGSLVASHGFELGLETRTREERAAERDRSDHDRKRRQMLDEAYSQLRLNKAVAGWQLMENWLKASRPEEQLPEYRAMLQAASAWTDPRLADRLVNTYLTSLLAKGDNGEALKVCEQRLTANPQFRVAEASHAVRLAELAGLAGKRALKRQLEVAK